MFAKYKQRVYSRPGAGDDLYVPAFIPRVTSSSVYAPTTNFEFRGNCEYFTAEWFSTMGIVSFDSHCYADVCLR